MGYPSWNPEMQHQGQRGRQVLTLALLVAEKVFPDIPVAEIRREIAPQRVNQLGQPTINNREMDQRREVLQKNMDDDLDEVVEAMASWVTLG